MFTPIALSNKYNLIVSSNQTDYNMVTDLTAKGWNGTSPVDVQVTINSGVILTASTTAKFGFTTEMLPANSRVKIVNNGWIGGKGGTGGSVGPSRSNGSAGGTGIKFTVATVVENYGTIAGGGGGGGGGGQAGCDCSSSSCGGYYCTGAVGGGGGAGYGVAGVGYTWCNASAWTSPVSGNAGTQTTGGAVSTYSGAGGGLGAAGTNGSQAANCGDGNQNGTSGGLGGSATLNQATWATWSVYGTYYGALN